MKGIPHPDKPTTPRTPPAQVLHMKVADFDPLSVHLPRALVLTSKAQHHPDFLRAHRMPDAARAEVVARLLQRRCGTYAPSS